MYFFRLVLASLLNRRKTALLTVFTIAMSVVLLIGVEKIRGEARNSFTQTISGTDLVIGARSGAVQLLLYSVFRMGNATNNIRWQSYETIAALPQVTWAIPLSLGDSHKGYRVLGTSADYFTHFRYGQKRNLEIHTGKSFVAPMQAVLGAEVSDSLGYQVGDRIVLAHGSERSFMEHGDHPVEIVGILKRTGTPVDQTVHVDLTTIELIHAGLQSDASVDLKPQQITAMLIGLKSKISTFKVQRFVNEFRTEPLSAIIPGAALQELWRLLAVVETALLAIAALVVVSGLLGMVTAVLTGLNERRRELAILRSVGARPGHIFLLVVLETGLITASGCIVGVLLLYGALYALVPMIESVLGLYLDVAFLSSSEWYLLAGVLVAGTLSGVIPALSAMRSSLSDGLVIRI